jgi:hypothetical protein
MQPDTIEAPIDPVQATISAHEIAAFLADKFRYQLTIGPCAHVIMQRPEEHVCIIHAGDWAKEPLTPAQSDHKHKLIQSGKRWRTLRVGSKGEAVEIMTRLLKDRGPRVVLHG